MIVLPESRWIGVESTRTERRAFVQAYLMLQEKCQISGYQQLHDQLPLFNAIKLLHAFVVVEIEAHVFGGLSETETAEALSISVATPTLLTIRLNA